jgi:hypothetical protein
VAARAAADAPAADEAAYAAADEAPAVEPAPAGELDQA